MFLYCSRTRIDSQLNWWDPPLDGMPPPTMAARHLGRMNRDVVGPTCWTSSKVRAAPTAAIVGRMRLLDDLVGTGQQQSGNHEAHRTRGFQIDEQAMPRGQIERDGAWVVPFENAIDPDSQLRMQVRIVE